MQISKIQATTLEIRAKLIERKLPKEKLKEVQQAKERGASTWLSVISLEEQGFKEEFRNALLLRYKK